MSMSPSLSPGSHGFPTRASESAAGRTTSLAIVNACLARIDQFEDRIQAWVLVHAEGARRQAAERDAELQAGRRRGPLHGVPIAIKDIMSGGLADIGLRRRLGNSRPDAPAVAKPREAAWSSWAKP